MSENTEIERDDVEAAAREAFEKFTVDAPEKEVEQPEVEDATDAEVVEEVETEAAEVETEEKQSEEKPEVEKEKPLKAPMGWKPDAKEYFDKLPEEVRMAVHAREVEIDRKLKETASERAFAQDMFKVLTPYDADIRASGQHPAQVLKTYLDIENTLNRGDQASKARVIANVIKNRNIDLEVLQDAIIEARGGKVEPRQDSTAALPPEIQERLKEIDRLKAAEDGRQHAQRTQFEQAIQNEFQTSGVEKREWFDDLRPHMQKLLENGQADDFQDAYDKAAWLSPDHRKVLLSRQAAPAGATVEQKRNAASSVKGSGPKSSSRSSIKQYDTPEDAARAAYNRFMGGDK